MTAAAPPEIFSALGDPTRWKVLMLLGERGSGTATSLAAELPVSRVAVVKHLGVLAGAGLVQGRRLGREMRYAVVPEELEVAGQELQDLASAWEVRLATIKRLAEGP